ncbi:MAG: glutathione S-transferase family protein [Cyclobacteriaceae bacterium]|nr:glutathione S-transferase family protein [Cyclobacteriaceae bacterium]
MILVGRLPSPFVRRTAVLLDLLGQPFELRPLSAFNDKAALRAINPLGRVPALIEGERTLVDSVAIAMMLCDRYDLNGHFLPRGGSAMADAMQLLFLANGTLEKFVAGYYERTRRPAEKVHEPWVEHCWGQASGGLAALERSAQALAESEEAPTYTHIAIATMTSFFRRLEPTFYIVDRYPRLERIRQRCEAIDAFARYPAT